jgi:hypothetical protein
MMYIPRGVYADGGLTCNLPVHMFPNEPVLCFMVRAARDVPENAHLSSVVPIYTDAAQMAALRGFPMATMMTVSCTPSAATGALIGLLGPLSFHASSEAIDALIADGTKAAEAMIRRNAWCAMLLLVFVFQSLRDRKPCI